MAANDLTNILPKILARGLITLRQRCIMPRLVNSDYGMMAAIKGSTIDVPVPTAVGTQDVSPSQTPITPVGCTPGLVQVALDYWRQNDPIYLTDKELCQIDQNEHFLPMQMMEAIKALASYVNQIIMGKYKGTLRGVFGFVGTPGTTPFGSGVGVSSATGARKILNKQLCPLGDRRGVLDFDAEAAALDLSAFSDAEKILSAIVKVEGDIGRKFGIDWVADDDAPYHTAGTIATTTGAFRQCAVNNGAGYAVGIDTINVDFDNDAGNVGAGTILLGDILSFAGHDQTYCVIANASSGQYSNGVYTFATNAIAGLKIYPALKTAVVDNEVATVKASHRVNMVFHRDAFAFATRPLLDVTSNLNLGSQILSMQDPVTGLVLRLEVSRQHKQVIWEYDILFGAELIRPELCCRLAG